jgi:hypothetical protein
MGGGEGRVCSVRTAVAELLEALSIEEVLYCVTTVPRDRRYDSSRTSFQALWRRTRRACCLGCWSLEERVIGERSHGN